MRRAGFMSLGAAAVLGAALPLAAAGTSTAVSEVEIRITDHAPGIADFRRLTVGLKRLSLHAKGEPHNAGWHELARALSAADIVPLKDGRYEAAGTGKVPAGRYDAVRIEFAGLSGELHSGKAPPLAARDTTVLASFDLRGVARTALTIDLYAENQSDHGPRRYVVKVRDLRIGN